jgi:glutathione S-transferase
MLGRDFEGKMVWPGEKEKSMQHNYELISFKLCPYVQRAVITLNYKKADFKLTYIDLGNKPDWFDEISPLGKVPVLRVDGVHSIFESAVIADFLDEVIPPEMNLPDPLAKAKERGWIEFGSQMIMHHGTMFMETDLEKAEEARKKLFAALPRLEKVVNGPFFRGSDFSLVDATFAPLFMRLKFLPETWDQSPLKDLPKTIAWAERLLALPEVKNSVVPDLKDEFFKFMQDCGSAILRSRRLA